jgi:hypothetical protein
LLLSWAAVRWRPAPAATTYGYQRAVRVAAFLNALTLVGVAFTSSTRRARLERRSRWTWRDDGGGGGRRGDAGIAVALARGRA